MKEKGKIKWTVMSVTVVLFIAMLAAIVVNAEKFYDILNNLVMNNAMWGLGMVIFCIVVMVTPLGKVKLGGPNARPKFSMMQWFGISLCTGIGAGVVFWGAAEPLIFAMDIPAYTGLESGSDGAVLWSMARCFMQWGLTPYATCVVTGLGYGAMQLSSAVKAFAGIEPSTMIYVAIIAVMFVCYNLSAVSGLRNGITWPSNRNVQLFFIILLFVFLAGPTAYICNLFTESLGAYLSDFFAASLNTAPYPDAGMWPQNWDMYWWVDWMAYAPLLGLFMVRCAYGRTLREFVLIEWLLPAVFGIVWFSVFGGTILHAQLWEGIDFLTIYQTEGAEALTLNMFNVLPLATIAKIVMLVIITISLVTQCDSMAVTLAGMCYSDADENTEPPVKLKLFWGTVFAVVAAVFVSLGGIGGVKTIKSFAGIPMCFICLACMMGFVRFILKRPRKVDGSFEDEPEVADAPDNGEPMAPKSKIKFLAKLGW